MVRWRQAPLTVELLTAAKAVVRPDLFDAMLDAEGVTCPAAPADVSGAFTGPAFDASDIAGYLACWDSKRSRLAHNPWARSLQCTRLLQVATRMGNKAPLIKPVACPNALISFNQSVP